MRGGWIVRRHKPGGDHDTLHASYRVAKIVERNAIMAAREGHGLAYRITLFRASYGKGRAS
jgi:hypothetical protein